MFEAIGLLFGLTLFGGVFWAMGVIISCVVLSFVFDYNEWGWGAFIAFLAALVVFYVWGNTPENLTILAGTIWSWKFLLWYLGLGFVHALIRTPLYGRDEQNRVNRLIAKKNSGSFVGDSELVINTNIFKHIFRWWFLFWASFPLWIVQKGVRQVYDMFLKKLFVGLVNFGASTVDSVVDIKAEKEKAEKEKLEKNKEKASYKEKEENHPN